MPRLGARIRDLETRLGLDSSNSSRPPSSDPPGVLRHGKKPTGSKRGGQKGHPGAYRSLLPPGRHQITELPPIRAHVTEHRLLPLACPDCGGRTRARLPAEVGPKHFGPRLTALAALLPSYREVRRAAPKSESARVDETGWRLRGQSRWLWTSATERATLFHLGRSRSARDLLRLLGRDYGGIVTSDRWSTYHTKSGYSVHWGWTRGHQ